MLVHSLEFPLVNPLEDLWRGFINFFADDGGLNATKIALSAGAVFVGNFQAAGVVDGSTF